MTKQTNHKTGDLGDRICKDCKPCSPSVEVFMQCGRLEILWFCFLSLANLLPEGFLSVVVILQGLFILLYREQVDLSGAEPIQTNKKMSGHSSG